MKTAIWILWPSFLIGGAAEVIFFTVFDPAELHDAAAFHGLGRLAAYSVGFLLFWAFAAASSALTLFLQRGPDEINR